MDSLTISDKHWLAYQLLSAVREMREHDFPHGRLSPHTIFVDFADWLVVTDPILNPLSESSRFSRFFVDPEPFFSLSKQPSFEDDLKSVGYI